jgi:hypothetical protein
VITWQTPLVTIPWSPDLDMRRASIANALSVVNVSAADPRTRPIFDDLLGPPRGGWGLDRPYGAGGVSTCSMVALGLLRRLGVDCPDIMDGYADNIGSGFRVARDWGRMLLPRPAWVTPIHGLRPNPGDVIDLRPKPGAGDPSNHTETVIGWKEAGGQFQIVCVAGGQVGARGLQAIHRVTRPWVERDGQAPTSGGRPVDGWLDVTLLPYRGPVTVPVGWESVSL